MPEAVVNAGLLYNNIKTRKENLLEESEVEMKEEKFRQEIGQLRTKLKEKNTEMDEISKENDQLRLQEKSDQELFCMERVLELQKEIDLWKDRLTSLQEQALDGMILMDSLDTSSPIPDSDDGVLYTGDSNVIDELEACEEERTVDKFDSSNADVIEALANFDYSDTLNHSEETIETLVDSTDDSITLPMIAKAVCIKQHDPQNCHYQKCFTESQKSITELLKRIRNLRLNVDEKQSRIEYLEKERKKLGATLHSARKENEGLENIIEKLQITVNEAVKKSNSFESKLNQTKDQQNMLEHYMDKMSNEREQRWIYEQLLTNAEGEIKCSDTLSRRLSKRIDVQSLESHERRDIDHVIKTGLEELKTVLLSRKKKSIFPRCVKSSDKSNQTLDIVNTLLKEVENT
ncbi:uncharacterized protein MCAP_0864-like [Clytia hemisphaerica]|uniref:Uncharacterized protein n=1 Tax=Clytia hemisphaerica TaxID=252671 RepID=A0A7M5TQK0_9CNID